jgi:peptide-methionine (S)-S-oxide reductase
VILCHDDGQRAAAREAAERVSLRLGRPVLTEVRPLETFYLAEEYHQHYYWKHFADAWKRAMREEAPGPASAEFAHWLETGVLPGCGVR